MNTAENYLELLAPDSGGRLLESAGGAATMTPRYAASCSERLDAEIAFRRRQLAFRPTRPADGARANRRRHAPAAR